jgi:histidinol dehydrogenase
MATYKYNTPNYNTNRKVVNFGDFCDNWRSEKEKLKSKKRSILNNSEVQQHVKNVKQYFDPVTRKWTDISKQEIQDKLEVLDEGVSELTDANVANLERFIKDYREKHTIFQSRGTQEGMAMLKKASSVEEAIKLINKKIENYKSLKDHTENVDGDLPINKDEIITGLQDFLKQLEAK